MKFGITSLLQNPGDDRPDHAVIDDHLALAEQAEALGFDSYWAPEHHCTEYSLGPDALQTLTYVAGATERIELGTCVVVLPWRDPVHVAEQIAFLDIVSKGRLYVGFGRGNAEREYAWFRIPMDESRGRFSEGFAIIKDLLSDTGETRGGQFYPVPKARLRPRPRSEITERFLMAAVSPESAEIAAKLDAGIMLVGDAPDQGDKVRRHRETLGVKAADRVACMLNWLVVADTDERARALAEPYLRQFSLLAGMHYGNLAELGKYKDYESWGKRAAAAGSASLDDRVAQQMATCVIGSPETCIRKLEDIESRVGINHFVGMVGFGGMSREEAEHSMQLYAKEIVPHFRAKT